MIVIVMTKNDAHNNGDSNVNDDNDINSVGDDDDNVND